MTKEYSVDEHGADEYCRVCHKAIRLRTGWSGMRNARYICCNGRDCGCGGGSLPRDLCSVSCLENETLEDLEDDGPLDLEEQLERALDREFPRA